MESLPRSLGSIPALQRENKEIAKEVLGVGESCVQPA